MSLPDPIAAGAARDLTGEQMLALARDRSLAGREALATSVATMVTRRGEQFSETEEAIAGDILRTLIRDVERSVRAALSANLAASSAAPRDVIVALANDDIEVAFPVLAESPILDDEELCRIVEERASGHRIAVAMRPGLSETVSDRIIDSEDVEAVGCLLHNSDASISERSLGRMVDHAQADRTYHKPLSGRPDLSPALALKLAGAVADVLRRQLVATYDLDPKEIRAAAAFAASDAREALAGDAKSDDDPDGEDGEDSAARREIRQMIDILRRKEWPHFEAAMVRFAGLPAALTHAVLAERDGRKFTVLCRASGVNKSDFASLFLLSRRATPDVEVVDADDVRKALALFDSIERPAAIRVVNRWRAKSAQRARRGFSR